MRARIPAEIKTMQLVRHISQDSVVFSRYENKNDAVVQWSVNLYVCCNKALEFVHYVSENVVVGHK